MSLEKQIVTLRLTTELTRQLDKKSQDLGISRNAYVQMILTKALKEVV